MPTQKRTALADSLKPGNVLQFKSNVEIPQEIKTHGSGPFTVLRKEGGQVFLRDRYEFHVSVLDGVKFFEPCLLRIC